MYNRELSTNGTVEAWMVNLLAYYPVRSLGGRYVRRNNPVSRVLAQNSSLIFKTLI